jgi:hypothetical protein
MFPTNIRRFAFDMVHNLLARWLMIQIHRQGFDGDRWTACVSFCESGEELTDQVVRARRFRVS